MCPATASAALDRGFEGVRFPRYDQWRATGERTDVIDGREVRTVFYAKDGQVIAYAIVAGPALSQDEALRVVRDDGVVAVTWTRAGRTCVIASAGGGAALKGLAYTLAAAAADSLMASRLVGLLLSMAFSFPCAAGSDSAVCLLVALRHPSSRKLRPRRG